MRCRGASAYPARWHLQCDATGECRFSDTRPVRPDGGPTEVPSGVWGSGAQEVVDLAIADAILAVAGALALRGRRAVGRRAALGAEEGIRVMGFCFGLYDHEDTVAVLGYGDVTGG